MAKSKHPFIYGKTPAPKSWAETADHLTHMTAKAKKAKSSGLMDRLDRIEAQLKGIK